MRRNYLCMQSLMLMKLIDELLNCARATAFSHFRLKREHYWGAVKKYWHGWHWLSKMTELFSTIWVFSLHDDVIKWEHFPRYRPFLRESTGHRWIPHTKTNDTELWCFLWSAPGQTLEQTIQTRWFETPSRSLWRQYNDTFSTSMKDFQYIWSQYIT